GGRLFAGRPRTFVTRNSRRQNCSGHWCTKSVTCALAVKVRLLSFQAESLSRVYRFPAITLPHPCSCLAIISLFLQDKSHSDRTAHHYRRIRIGAISQIRSKAKKWKPRAPESASL